MSQERTSIDHGTLPTPDQLRALVKRHAADDHHLPARLDDEQAHADRGVLLDLLGRMAQRFPRKGTRIAIGWTLCGWCGAAPGPDSPCRPDCPEPLLEALR